MKEEKNNKMFDVIVIGAGIGGLFAAAKLSKEGKKVLILEQHTSPGGYANTFKRGNFTFEASMHTIDGFFENNNPNLKIFEELDILNNIKFIRLPEFYKVWKKGFTVTIPDDKYKARKKLEKIFPKDIKAIQYFFKTIIGLRKEILKLPVKKWKILISVLLLPFKYSKILKHLRTTLGIFIDNLTDDENLKLVLTANAGYYHKNPFEYSTLHYGGAQSSYFSGGCAYIQGGSQKIVDYLIDYIKKKGGEVRFKHYVDKIVILNNQVNGVVYHNHANGNHITEYSNYVVANASIPIVINEMLPATHGKKLKKKLGSYKIAHSVFSLYLGLSKPLKEIGNSCYSTFLLPNKLSKFSKVAYHNKTNNFSEKIITLVDYSIIDARLTEDNKPVASCVVIDEVDHWESLTPSEYKEKKEKSCQQLIARLEEFLPGLRDSICYYEAATPLTMKRYTCNPRGCIYGFAQIPTQVGINRPDQFSGIKGLYFASAWSKPGGGISAVAKCGYTAACAILKIKN